MSEKRVQVVVGGDSSGAEKAFRKVSDESSRMGTSIEGAVGAVRAFQGAIAAMGLTMVARDLLDAGIAADKLRNSMAAAAGSSQMGAIEMGFVREQAARLGLDLQSTAEAYVKLTASARGTALEGQPTREIFSAISEAATSLGLSADEASGAFLAISQMMAKGKVSAEELRGQIGERLPGAMRAAAEAIRLPNESLQEASARLEDMMKKGELIASDFLPKFAAAMKTEFPASEEATKSLGAEVNRLKTSFFDLKNTIMDAGGSTIFSALISDTRTLFDEMSIGIQKVEQQQGFWNKLDMLLNLSRRRGLGQFMPDEFKGEWQVDAAGRDPFSYTPEEIKKLQAQFVARELMTGGGGSGGGGGGKRPSWATSPTRGGFFNDAADTAFMEESLRGSRVDYAFFLNQTIGIGYEGGIGSNYRLPGSHGPSLLGPGGLDGFLTQAATEKQAYLDQTEQMYQSQIEMETAMYEQRAAGRLRDLENERAIAAARGQVGTQITGSLMNLTNALYLFTGKKSKELFMLNKAAGIADATVSTYVGAANAMKTVPYPYNFVAAASVIAYGLAQVASIASTDFGSGGPAAAGGTGGGTPDSPIVTQPLSAVSQQTAVININMSGVYADRDKMLQWAEDELAPVLRDLTTRKISFTTT